MQCIYLRYKAAGDQYVHREGYFEFTTVVTKFLVLPCQVDCSVDECNEMVFSLFPTIPYNSYCLCYFFAAAILYHSNFLKTILPPSNLFFSNLLLTSSKIPKLIKQTFVKYTWEECGDISVYGGEYNVEDRELSTIIRDTGRIVRDP